MPASPSTLSAYERFLTAHPLPIWWQPDWLEAASVESGGDWDVALLTEDDRVVAAWPYAVYRRGPFTLLANPPLTPRLGIAFEPLDGHPASQLIERRRRIGLLLEQLPPYAHFHQNFLPEFGSWQPLRWAGFDQRSKTTYVVDCRDLARVYDGLHGSLRRHLKQAQDDLQIFDHGGLLAFWQLNEATFARQQQPMPYSFDLLAGIDAVAEAQGRRKILFAANHEGQLVAALYLVWDARAVTYLASGYDDAAKDSSAMPLLIWRGFELAHQLGLPFDFEGSDLEGVAEFFARFGGQAVSLHEIRRTPSRLYRILQGAKDSLRGG